MMTEKSRVAFAALIVSDASACFIEIHLSCVSGSASIHLVTLKLLGRFRAVPERTCTFLPTSVHVNSDYSVSHGLT
jgi:hypothetical protein